MSIATGPSRIMGTIASLLTVFIALTPQTSWGQNLTARPAEGANVTHAVGPTVEHLVTKTDGGSLYLAFDIGSSRPTTITFLDATSNRTVSSVDYDVVVRTANTSS